MHQIRHRANGWNKEYYKQNNDVMLNYYLQDSKYNISQGIHNKIEKHKILKEQHFTVARYQSKVNLGSKCLKCNSNILWCHHDILNNSIELKEKLIGVVKSYTCISAAKISI
jgi:uncharacterized membrane protein YfhO